MSARQRKYFRITVMGAWLVLALILVVPVLAQDGTGTTTSSTGTSVTSDQPQDLNEVGARLAPLLVGAALIERTLEFVFSWSQRAILDTTSSLRGLAKRITGLVQIDFKQSWEQLQNLTHALQVRSSLGLAPTEGDPNSSDPAEWPLATLEAQLSAVEKTLTETQSRLEQVMSSDLYKERKKMVAGVMSIVLGIALALVAHLRLFEALDVQVAGWFEKPFGAVDMVLAGILMGLGTDWVHQVINLITKGQGFLGRAAGGGDGGGTVTVNNDALSQLVSDALQKELDGRLKALRDDVQQHAENITKTDLPNT